MADTTYGRGDQHAKNPAGNNKMKDPTSGHDARDKAPVRPIHAHLEATPAKPGRGSHDSSLLGG